MGDIAKILGDRIRILRTEHGLSQEDLALRAKMSRSYLGELERGEKSASVDSLEKIVSALEISFEELFRYILPSSESVDNTVLSLLFNKMLTLSTDEQNTMLTLFDTIQLLVKQVNEIKSK